nr:hypothetical protein [Tanacetum cinerariifolium]
WKAMPKEIGGLRDKLAENTKLQEIDSSSFLRVSKMSCH